MSEIESDHLKYRGKCREVCTEAVAQDDSLRLVRGYYYDLQWGKQPHWWCVRTDGSIYDPTANQFPSRGLGHYEEFDGWFECAECGKRIKEEGAIIESRYALCSGRCYCRFVGVYQ